VIHDADVHIMEAPDFLDGYVDQRYAGIVSRLKTTPRRVARSAILTNFTCGIMATEDLIVVQTRYRLTAAKNETW
jgi:hypothetical protein